MSTISLNPSRSTTPIYLLPRLRDERNPARDWRIPVEAPSQFWTSHVDNAFEEKHGPGNTEIMIQASVCSYQWFSFKKLFGYDWESEKLDPSFMNVGKEELPHLVQYAVFKKRCYCAVLDVKRVGHDDVVVAKMEVPEHLTFPFGFHGFWVHK
ncbi:hypothetical protein KSP40_PGU016371 [Platanthera guangdongensis]|uniref:Uncharacterized protein n=1 Tax=Platanthera guangdongensis TaxID=2320717 RepID=A0ABR2LN26_9ASPA